MADEDPKPPATPFTQEQLQALGPVLNNMLTARMGSFEKKIATTLGESLAKTLDDKLQALRPAPQDPEGEGKDGKGKNRRDDVEMATLRKTVEEMTRKQAEVERRWQDERYANRSNKLRQVVNEQLSAVGIDSGVFQKGAFAALQIDGRIKYRDDDSDDLVFVDAVGQELELKTGLAEWAKTPEAKIYIPPTGARGSGSGPPRGGAPPTDPSKMSAEQRRLKVSELLNQEVQGAMRPGFSSVG